MNYRLMTILLLFSSSILLSFAQTTYVATLTVTYDQVELLRTGASNWLPLSEGAVAPFGEGDQLRTLERGRVLLNFNGELDLLILSGSEYQLNTFDIEDEETVIEASLNGVAIQRIDDANFANYLLQLRYVDITTPAEWMGIWTEPDEPDAIMVASGEATLVNVGNEIVLNETEGIFVMQDTVEMNKIDPPLNPARLEASIRGCEGVIQTEGGLSLRVRNGPGLGYLEQGLIEDGTPVELVGINNFSSWYRMQYLSGFGWMQALAIETTCNRLDSFPNDFIESIRFVTNADEMEVTILEPFYGLPLFDGFFYRFDQTP